MTSQNRRGQNNINNGGGSKNKTTSQNNNSGSQTTPKKVEFRYQVHDGSRRGGYTFKKITQAVILKIKTTFQGGRYIVNSLRARRKLGPATPTRGTSVITDVALKAIEQETFNRKYEAQLAHYFT